MKLLNAEAGVVDTPAPTKYKGDLIMSSITENQKVIKNLCPICGADVDVWREVFNEEHHCEVHSHKGNWCPFSITPRFCQEDYCVRCEVYRQLKEGADE